MLSKSAEDPVLYDFAGDRQSLRSAIEKRVVATGVDYFHLALWGEVVLASDRSRKFTVEDLKANPKIYGAREVLLVSAVVVHLW